ncbi:MAG: YbbR-like protein [Syntrophaceae bacterium PtaU1.Bin231]|nr:MAG: YbbR-like protein [Syntrophaceae bacterium PtaU1.Bin231]
MRNSSFFQLIVRNLGWLLVSLLLALAIWVAANMANNPVEQHEIRAIPVRVEVPDGYVITGQPDSSTVTAIVRAARSDWDLLLPEDILVTADLGHIRKPGEYRIELTAAIADPLHGKVVALRPSTWMISLDTQVEQRLAIQVVVTNDPPLGYTYPADLACAETEVLVRGSAESVADVARVEARLNLSNDRNPVTRTINLVAVKANGQTARSADVQLLPSSVDCNVDIQTREDVTPVEVLPNRGGTNPPPGYTFEGYTDIQPSTVGVTGDTDAIAAMNQVIKTTPIDLTDKTATFTIEVPLALPSGVTLVSNQQLISVTVIISPVLSNREFQEVPVQVNGLDETRFRASGFANTVTVNVAGPQIRLSELKPDDLSVVLDLSGLGPGNHQVKPTATIVGQGADNPFTISGILPEQFSVTIEAIEPTPTAPATASP